MKKTFLLFSTLLALLTLAGISGAAEKKAGAINQAKGLRELTLFFANDVRGETEPCG